MGEFGRFCEMRNTAQADLRTADAFVLVVVQGGEVHAIQGAVPRKDEVQGMHESVLLGVGMASVIGSRPTLVFAFAEELASHPVAAGALKTALGLKVGIFAKIRRVIRRWSQPETEE